MDLELLRCPVCGFLGLEEPPRGVSGGGSYEICRSCGFEFGVTDDDQGYSYEAWREKWVRAGMRWYGEGIEDPPADWNPAEDLKYVTGRSAR